ncbi:ribonuclease HII [Metamycoplasma equirhinis]|uniref:ribonuclease HII n=1 Tax=Metamycoplasma equirhinis TaxID=92402 RepID=UPI0035945123
MKNLDFENSINDYKSLIIAGTDEAGRGCCAGPLFVAAVVLPTNYQNSEINDSKLLSEANRNKLYDEIVKNALAYSIVEIPASDIDKYNPKQASKIGMKLAIQKLKIRPSLVITDYEEIDINIKQINLVHGDSLSVNVAAASILAKVSRDRKMYELAKKYPQYHFEKNKGYCTKSHTQALHNFGACPEHRVSYKNVKVVL